MSRRARVSEQHLIYARLVGSHNAITFVFVDFAVDDSKVDSALFCFSAKCIALVGPVKKHQAVFAFLDQIKHHFVAAVIHKNRGRFHAVDRT